MLLIRLVPLNAGEPTTEVRGVSVHWTPHDIKVDLGDRGSFWMAFDPEHPYAVSVDQVLSTEIS